MKAKLLRQIRKDDLTILSAVKQELIELGYTVSYGSDGYDSAITISWHIDNKD
jgi:hypothetical protein